jgi:protein-disulfide isomerase
MEKTMKSVSVVSVVGGAMLAGLIWLAPQPSRAQDLRGEIEAIVKDYLATHPDEVGEIVKDYMKKHPEAVTEILVEVLKHRSTAAASTSTSGTPGATKSQTAAERTAAIASDAALLLSSPHQVTLGNPHGDVTLVEFFDYSCGFCKRALPDLVALLKDDPNLRIVLKEFPILGAGSAEAARVAIAVRMQDPDGQRYLAFHQELLGGTGPVSADRALAAAMHQGLDMAKVQQDMASDEVKTTLAEDMKLAGDLGIRGTPTYVIGKDVVVGAIGLVALKGQIEMARSQTAN